MTPQPAPDALNVLRRVDQFIRNGIEFGYITMPDQGCPDSAHEIPSLVREAVKALSGQAGADPAPLRTIAPERIAEIRHDMRCAVTQKRCDEFGCAHEGATVMPREWRCHACTAFEALNALTAQIAHLTQERDEWQRRAVISERFRMEDGYDHGQDQLLAAEARKRLDATLARVTQERDAYEGARQRVRDYIVTAMRPASVAAACGEGLWERSHREGLKHALNAIDAEFAKALADPPVSSSTDAAVARPSQE